MAFADRQRLTAMAWKEFLQQIRDPQTLRVMLLAPVLQMVVLGFAVTNDLRNVNVGVLDEDRTPQSRRALDIVASTGYFRMEPLDSPEALARALDTGQQQATIRVPPGFARELARGRVASVQVMTDASDTNTASLAYATIVGAFRAYSKEVAVDWTDRNGRAATEPVELRPQMWYNPAQLSRHFILPGVVALIVTVMGSILTVLGIAREREVGTLEQLLVSPVTRTELMLGKMIPPAALALTGAATVIALSVLVFRIPFRGSVLTIAAGIVPFLIALLGLGLLISSRAATQQQAQLLNFFTMLPQALLSGFIFPIETMPSWAKALSSVVPMTYFLRIVRGVYIKGSGVADLWQPLAVLWLLGVVIFAAGARSLRRQLD